MQIRVTDYQERRLSRTWKLLISKLTPESRGADTIHRLSRTYRLSNTAILAEIGAKGCGVTVAEEAVPEGAHPPPNRTKRGRSQAGDRRASFAVEGGPTCAFLNASRDIHIIHFSPRRCTVCCRTGLGPDIDTSFRTTCAPNVALTLRGLGGFCSTVICNIN